MKYISSQVHISCRYFYILMGGLCGTLENKNFVIKINRFAV